MPLASLSVTNDGLRALVAAFFWSGALIPSNSASSDVVWAFGLPACLVLHELKPFHAVLVWVGGAAAALVPIAVVMPRLLRANQTRWVVAALIAACLSHVNAAITIYREHYGQPHEQFVKSATATFTVLCTCGAAMSIWTSNGATFWSSFRLGLGLVSTCRLGAGLLLRATASPLPHSYPPGLPFEHALAVNLALLGISFGITLPARTWLSAKALKSGHGKPHRDDPVVPFTPRTPVALCRSVPGPDEALSRGGSAEIM